MFLFCALCRDRAFDGRYAMRRDHLVGEPDHNTQNIVNLNERISGVLGPLIFAKVLNRGVSHAIAGELYEELGVNQLLHEDLGVDGVARREAHFKPLGPPFENAEVIRLGPNSDQKQPGGHGQSDELLVSPEAGENGTDASHVMRPSSDRGEQRQTRHESATQKLSPVGVPPRPTLPCRRQSRL
jgi:hypothetical protein